MSKLNFCEQCGNKLEKDDKFCAECGWEITTVNETEDVSTTNDYENEKTYKKIDSRKENYKSESSNKQKKKKGCLKWIFLLVALLVAIVIIAPITFFLFLDNDEDMDKKASLNEKTEDLVGDNSLENTTLDNTEKDLENDSDIIVDNDNFDEKQDSNLEDNSNPIEQNNSIPTVEDIQGIYDGQLIINERKGEKSDLLESYMNEKVNTLYILEKTPDDLNIMMIDEVLFKWDLYYYYDNGNYRAEYVDETYEIVLKGKAKHKDNDVYISGDISYRDYEGNYYYTGNWFAKKVE